MIELDQLQAACPSCGEAAYRRRRGEWTLAARILRISEAGVVAVCDRCGGDVPVPFLGVVGKVRPVVRRRLVDTGSGTV